MRRMLPHTLGYFPMVAAWVIIVVHLETAKRDLTYITDRTMPEWVNGAVYGTVVIFWSFSVVQIIYQRLAPGFYFGTELTYCALSLTSKLWLGWFILLNVLYNKPEDGGADAALRGANEGDS